MKVKKIIIAAVVTIIGIIIISLGSNLIETNQDGYYQVKQQFVTGDMSVRSIGGTYWQGNGTIWSYKNVATVGFGKEDGEGTANISSIPVVFSDGSKAEISGVARVKLPKTVHERLILKEEFADGYDHFIVNGVVPIVKNAVKLSANLRSAQDAYTTLAVFQQAIQDQLENGTYVTKSDKKEFISSTGDKEVRQVTVIVLNKETGQPQRIPNRLQELGCEIVSCVIDVPEFDPAVVASINMRKDEAMKTELAKQSAIRAKQDAITSEEQGKANVAKAKYEEEVKKERAVVAAQQKYEVAALNAKEAGEKKKAVILAAEAKKQELLIADGLSELAKYQIDANKEAQIETAKALANWVGPQIVMSGGNSKGSNGVSDALMIQMMQQIAKDMGKSK